MSVVLPPRLSKTQLQTEYELLTLALVLRKEQSWCKMFQVLPRSRI
jgi:hypothetical protein